MHEYGSVVVGETPETALVACTFIEENARVQVEAEAMGDGRITAVRHRIPGPLCFE